MNRYRVIDPEGNQPVTVVEIVGPPTEDIARGIAARAILGYSPAPANSPALRAVADRLVVKPVDDRSLRWAVTRLHRCFEETDGWAFEGHEIRVAEYSPDGVIIAFHAISRRTGRASRSPAEYILVTARRLQGLRLGF